MSNWQTLVYCLSFQFVLVLRGKKKHVVTLLVLVLHHTPSTTRNTNSTPNPIKAVEPLVDFQEEVAPFVDAVDDAVDEVVVTVEGVVDVDDKVVVVGTAGKVKVG